MFNIEHVTSIVEDKKGYDISEVLYILDTYIIIYIIMNIIKGV